MKFNRYVVELLKLNGHVENGTFSTIGVETDMFAHLVVGRKMRGTKFMWNVVGWCNVQWIWFGEQSLDLDEENSHKVPQKRKWQRRKTQIGLVGGGARPMHLYWKV